MRVSLILGALGALCVAGCGSRGGGAYQPPPTKGGELKQVSNSDLTAATAIPLKVGNQWVYQVEVGVQTAKGSGSSKGELTWKITKLRDVAGGKEVTMQVSGEDAAPVTYTWLVNDKGLFQTKLGGKTPITYSPPMPTVMFPADADRVFKWKGISPLPNGKTGQVTMSAEIGKPVRVDTAAEPRMAIPVIADYMYGAKIGRQRNSVYFTPGIGIVRIVDELGTPEGNRIVRTLLKSFREAR